MIILYSDGVSNIISKTAIRDNWKLSDDGFKVVLYNILAYINDIKKGNTEVNLKLANYLSKVKPEILLLEYAFNNDKDLYELLKDKFIKTKNINIFGFSDTYIIKN